MGAGDAIDYIREKHCKHAIEAQKQRNYIFDCLSEIENMKIEAKLALQRQAEDANAVGNFDEVPF